MSYSQGIIQQSQPAPANQVQNQQEDSSELEEGQYRSQTSQIQVNEHMQDQVQNNHEDNNMQQS